MEPIISIVAKIQFYSVTQLILSVRHVFASPLITGSVIVCDVSIVTSLAAETFSLKVSIRIVANQVRPSLVNGGPSGSPLPYRSLH